VRGTPIALYRRDRGEMWRAGLPDIEPAMLPLSSTAKAMMGAFDSRGALFFGDLVNTTGLLRTEVEKGLAELVAWGLVSSDSFAGLRALLVPSDRRRPLGGGYRRRGRIAPFGVENAGRWTRTPGRPVIPEEQVAEAIAWQLLRRYGVVFRRLVQRETLVAPWREILRVYRRLEARGEIRGGRFVGGFSGEQYALPEAIGLLRNTRREGGADELIAVSGADPLNLVGILTPDEAVPAITTNRVLYRDGVPIVVKEGDGERFLVDVPAEERDMLRGALMRRRPAPLVRTYLGKSKAAG
jgi:ATP-dependent Lhr-like helicase